MPGGLRHPGCRYSGGQDNVLEEPLDGVLPTLERRRSPALEGRGHAEPLRGGHPGCPGRAHLVFQIHDKGM